jgi:hypothetical protein
MDSTVYRAAHSAKYVARKGTAPETSANTIRSRLDRFGLFALHQNKDGCVQS